MKKNILITAAVITTVIATSGCGNSPDEPKLTGAPVDPATASSSSPAAATATPAPRSPRGNLIKKVGEPALVLIEEGSKDWALNFTVTDIQVDPGCTSPQAVPAENGHFVVVSLEAATVAEPEFSEVLGGVHFGGWKAIASNGTTVNNVMSTASFSCLGSAERIPSSMGAAEKVAGKVVLDVPDVSGTLVHTQGGGTGWEWEYDAK
ncbi:hypothetical protein [Arthrobacter sp. zg-Y769]|uniref:hypothetical protein n=1 Tax=Arthrobacter sp. zg-Y769 TaxID=2894191 RepID=UPI001E547C67|nr:hypothetical protein [Arthrobacter sp. zg-Y769]MCC9206498.1 hypothetical protein [Arthrobacter sp. zg-Y769]